MACFIRYSRLQFYNKRTLARVPVNFETVLRFLTEHRKANTFVPFRSLWDFTTALKTVFLLFHWDSGPCATLRKLDTGKVGPRTLWWDPTAESWARTLRCNPGLGSYGRTLRWDPTVGPSSKTVGWDTKMNDKIKV